MAWGFTSDGVSVVFSCRRDVPSNRAFSSIASVRWKISPSTTAVLFSLTRLAWMVPLTCPPIVNSSATTSPSICALSALGLVFGIVDRHHSTRPEMHIVPYCRGGIGARDDGAAIGTRDD